MLNEGLSIVLANGTCDEIRKRWFPPIIDTRRSVRERYSSLLSVLFPSAILIFIISTIYLRFEVLRT